jgi:LPXTG-motif cell wall-anchored protein
MNRALGIVFTLAGAIMLVIAVVNSQKKKDVVDIGPIHVTADQKDQNNWMPYAGGVLFLGGIVLLVTSKRSR